MRPGTDGRPCRDIPIARPAAAGRSLCRAIAAVRSAAAETQKGSPTRCSVFAQRWSAGTPRSTCSPQPATDSSNSLRSAVESDGSNNKKSTSTTNPQVSREPGRSSVLDRRRSARRARAGGSTDAIVSDKCGFARIAGARRGHARARREQWCRRLHRASRAVSVRFVVTERRAHRRHRRRRRRGSVRRARALGRRSRPTHPLGRSTRVQRALAEARC